MDVDNPEDYLTGNHSQMLAVDMLLDLDMEEVDNALSDASNDFQLLGVDGDDTVDRIGDMVVKCEEHEPEEFDLEEAAEDVDHRYVSLQCV